ncbi:hypothetical protein L249_8053 [Ophiocordyceps polyrhachis-furcata BCC 54312]|uniref:Rhodopsin domain-containing protein n=1 Tax=Ophiocordyceps polyrhachis-furcata BCC 54312 TaxID=1330021 RepID=A0A367LI61_9HYPO|nr:hypothetical protein L249_8053 [Ophiocordyceps polyrhachis-furcata BCC 54312]
MILLRVAGRFIRTERLFREDRIAAAALVPLVCRLVCVHFVLVWGTNNVDLSGLVVADAALDQRRRGSGIVLAGRVFYAATLWILKYAILEFLKRLTDLTWRRSHLVALAIIRWTLVLTFVAVLVSILAECRPFSHYWQVVPDPGGQCRQGLVQLIVMATCNIATDALLVIFPVPIILSSQMRLRRKLQLIMLFSLSLSVVAVTVYRLPHILRQHGRQQYRSLMASVELIFATASANALVLGSFVRDRGIKKHKFSVADSFDRTSYPRRPTIQQQWGSDEDLVRDVGLSLEPTLRRPSSAARADEYHHLQQQQQQQQQQTHHSPPPRNDSLSFLDVGGLLLDSSSSSSNNNNNNNNNNKTLASVVPASATGRRRGSTALLQDLRGDLTEPPSPRAHRSYDSQRDAGPPLMDPGGLLTTHL